MITRVYSTITRDVDSSQMWGLMSDVDHWSEWDEGIESAKLSGPFVAGSVIALRPKGGPDLQVHLLDVRPTSYFKDVTKFPLAQMNDEHWYEDTPEGLKITSKLTMKGPLSFVWNKLVMKTMADNIPADIARQIERAKSK